MSSKTSYTLTSPKTATLLEGSARRRCVDLLELCRRFIAEYLHKVYMPMGELVSYKENVPAEVALPEVVGAAMKMGADALQFGFVPVSDMLVGEKLETFVNALKTMPQVRDAKFRKLVLKRDTDRYRSIITNEDFCRSLRQHTSNLKEKHIAKILWALRLRVCSCVFLDHGIGQIIPKLKKMGYDGFLLPNGDKVSFESLHFLGLDFVPSEFTIYNFKLIEGISGKYAHHDIDLLERPGIIEAVYRFDKTDGLLVHHTTLAFHLPGKTSGSKDRLFIVDPACAQFGSQGPNGGLVYWGYLEDYIQIFPASKVKILGYSPHTRVDFGFGLTGAGPSMVKGVARNMKLASCFYCGEVENRRRSSAIVLKKCSRCRNVSYCGVFCQKLSWPSHKLECRPSEVSA